MGGNYTCPQVNPGHGPVHLLLLLYLMVILFTLVPNRQDGDSLFVLNLE